jgi:hypothetical protein
MCSVAAVPAVVGVEVEVVVTVAAAAAAAAWEQGPSLTSVAQRRHSERSWRSG